MREKLGIEDAEAVEDEILLDELIDAPEVRAAIVREALGEAGLERPVATEATDVRA